jgi:alpha-D-ribose 1-methylphosphonate 5-triphosphate diphosphatase
METIYTNATIITRDETVHGTLVVEGEVIKDVDSSIFRGCGAVDLKGEMLLPGLSEIHTDNLEKNIQPRPGVIWPSIMSAALAHDAQVAGAGITTVFDDRPESVVLPGGTPAQA